MSYIPDGTNNIRQFTPNPIYHLEEDQTYNAINLLLDYIHDYTAFFAVEAVDFGDLEKETIRTKLRVWLPTHSFTVTYLQRRYNDEYSQADLYPLDSP